MILPWESRLVMGLLEERFGGCTVSVEESVVVVVAVVADVADVVVVVLLAALVLPELVMTVVLVILVVEVGGELTFMLLLNCLIRALSTTCCGRCSDFNKIESNTKSISIKPCSLSSSTSSSVSGRRIPEVSDWEGNDFDEDEVCGGVIIVEAIRLWDGMVF